MIFLFADRLYSAKVQIFLFSSPNFHQIISITNFHGFRNDVYRSRLRPIEQPQPTLNSISSYLYRKRIIHLKMLAKCLINPNIQNNGKLSTSSCLFHIKIILRLHTTKLPTPPYLLKDTFHPTKKEPPPRLFLNL